MIKRLIGNEIVELTKGQNHQLNKKRSKARAKRLKKSDARRLSRY